MSKIAVIDSGIKKDDAICKLNIIQSLSIHLNENNKIVETYNSKCRNSHGTVIADIITYINPLTEIIDINILDDNLQTSGAVLLNAINRAIELKPNIINLSLGTNKLKYIIPMQRLIRKAKRNNIVVVAAYDNCNKLSFPAALRGVVGVKRISSLNIQNNKYMYTYKGSTYYAPDTNSRVCNSEGMKNKYFMQGNSMSAAYISGQLSLIVDNYNELSMKEVIIKLRYNILNYSY